MKDINYFEIVKNAFVMTKKNKSMWFFGFLVFIGSLVSKLNFNGKFPKGQQETFHSLIDTIQKYPNISIALTAFLIILAIALYLLKLIATASLIKLSNNIVLYGQMKISLVFNEGKIYVWKLLGLEVLVWLTLIIVAALLLMPIGYLFSLDSKVFASIFLLFAAIILLSLFLLVFYIVKFGQIFLVLSEIKLRTAIESAYELFIENIKESMIFGLISIAISLLFLMATMLLALIFAFITALIAYLAYLIFAKVGSIIIVTISAAVLLVLIATIFSWLIAFFQAAWVLFFQQISFKKANEDEITETEAQSILPTPEPA